MKLLFRSRIFLQVVFYFGGFSSIAQTNGYLELHERDFHKSAREALRQEMPDSSMVVIFSAPVCNRANDVDFPYHQNPDFRYFTGFAESNSIVFIFKEKHQVAGVESNEVLFVKEKIPSEEVWTGKRLGVEVAAKELGIGLVLPFKEFFSAGIPWGLKKVYFSGDKGFSALPSEENSGMAEAVVFAGKKMNEKNRNEKNELQSTQSIERIFAQLRQVKTETELKFMRQAIDITCRAEVELMKSLDTAMSEYNAEAIVEYVFRAEGATGPAFPSIVGSGENSCILHYTENNRKMASGDLVVVDIGAEVRGYAADVTRTLPVNGKFSEEQKLIYQLVLDAQKAGIEACMAGNQFMKPGKEATRVISEGLVNLGIIKDRDDVRKYFIHGTSHYLGLDVHDAGTYGKLAPGQVITVEPGIYIPEGSPCERKWWNIGVRIEDDVLITEKGFEVLSDKAPKTILEIEKLMREEGNFKINFGK